MLARRYCDYAGTVSCAAGHPAMVGHDVIRPWHARRVDGYKMNVATKAEHVNIVGDLAIVGGVFRISRNPEDGVPASSMQSAGFQ